MPDTLGILEQYDEAVSILERLERTPDAPAYVRQWLGYFLLFVDREDDAIRYSEEYHKLFPDESDSLFNVACGYAQKYCRDVRLNKGAEPEAAENRVLALSNLKEALSSQPDYAQTAREKWTKQGESFDCLANDTEFRTLVGLPSDKPEVAVPDVPEQR